MSVVNDKRNLLTLMSYRGVDVIGDGQRTIAYTVVASGGTGLLNFTAAAHGLKKGQSIYVASGAYQGIYIVKKIISANVFQVLGTFGATAAGNINLTACKDGEGFIVNDNTAFAIAAIELDDPNIDTATLIAKEYINGEIIPIPFKSIRLTAGTITCVRKTPQTIITSYTRR